MNNACISSSGSGRRGGGQVEAHDECENGCYRPKAAMPAKAASAFIGVL